MRAQNRVSPRLFRYSQFVPVTAADVSRYELQESVRSLPLCAGVVGVIQDWIEIPIGDGWIAAYRLAHRGRGWQRRTHILEVRVFPDGGDRSPGEWHGMFKDSDDVRVPKASFSFARLQRGLTEKLFNASLDATRENASRQGALEALGEPQRRHAGSKHEGRGAGRPEKYGRSHYARLAVRYHTIEHIERLSQREQGESTRAVLATEHGVPITTIGKWLKIARQQGFLTPVARGQRGSMATDSARRLASVASSRKEEK